MVTAYVVPQIAGVSAVTSSGFMTNSLDVKYLDVKITLVEKLVIERMGT
ncbi:hypothetical protein FB565_002465 [Actinoplanes lutulentus]|uniref:Uncharacterized protein n=1 Tax=Actinoplanes lutulentus TaxID=1287878 RepID=A0A327ZDW6_9ACTN|nr:hypothetical protein [Actinoplanes lutulentus]MBB2942752.1 hypothetical protein [Actinoplanes lutulentus]RAK38332.1 hypothetical protein B0I29_105280 [Actinoplanes lutulentus]